jgi:hypothetical protein
MVRQWSETNRGGFRLLDLLDILDILDEAPTNIQSHTPKSKHTCTYLGALMSALRLEVSFVNKTFCIAHSLRLSVPISFR